MCADDIFVSFFFSSSFSSGNVRVCNDDGDATINRSTVFAFRIRGRKRQNRSDRKKLRYCEIIIVKVSICLFVCLYVCIHLICPRMMIQAIREHFNGIFISTQTWPLYCLIFVLTSSYLFVSRYSVGLYNCWRSFWILPKYCTGKVTNGNYMQCIILCCILFCVDLFRLFKQNCHRNQENSYFDLIYSVNALHCIVNEYLHLHLSQLFAAPVANGSAFHFLFIDLQCKR